MLMVNYLQRFLFKWKYALLIILIISALAAAVSFQINRWLPDYALSFSDFIAQQSQTKISFKIVRYRFPNYIIFKDVKVLEVNGKTLCCKLPGWSWGFLFPLFSSATPLRYMVMDDMTINFPALKDYWAHHGKKFPHGPRHFPKGKLRLLVPNGRFYLTDRTSR